MISVQKDQSKHKGRYKHDILLPSTCPDVVLEIFNILTFGDIVGPTVPAGDVHLRIEKVLLNR